MSWRNEVTSGDRIGRYELLEELGRGAMGRVFLAKDHELREHLCVKVLHQAMNRFPAVVERFSREIVLARRVAHAGVCRVHELHDVDGVRFLTMEYVKGRTLRDLIDPAAPLLGVSEAVAIALKIAEALAAAHDVGVVHRDLKPGNVLVRDDGSVCLLDFGIATAPDLRSVLTTPGMILGTKHYIAPEAWEGRTATPQSDQFALGVVLYKCLTSRAPFAADPSVPLLPLLEQLPAPPSHWTPSVPSALDAVVLRALAFQPERRFADVRAMADALRPLLPVLQNRDRALACTQPNAVIMAEETTDENVVISWPPMGGAAGARPANQRVIATELVRGASAFGRSDEEDGRLSRRFWFTAAGIIAAAGVAALGSMVVVVGSAAEARTDDQGRDERAHQGANARATQTSARDDASSAESIAPPVATAEPAPAKVTRKALASVDRTRWEVAKGDMDRVLRTWGLMVGDEPELDRLRSEASALAQDGRYSEAATVVVTARAWAQSVVVDGAFVRAKLVRFNRRYASTTGITEATRSKLDALSDQFVEDVMQGKSKEANQALNEGFAALRKTRSQ